MTNKTYHVPSYIQELLTVSMEGIEQITGKLASLLSLPVLITDPLNHELQSASLDHEFCENILAIERLTKVDNNDSFKCKIMSANFDILAFATPIIEDSQTLGYIYIIDENNNVDLESVGSILTFAASLCSIQLKRKKELKQEQMKFKEAFLFDLLYGNMKQPVEILEYGKIWGWDLSLPLTAVVFSLQDFNHVSTDKQLINHLHYIIERTLNERNVKPITLPKQSQVIVILTMQGNEDKLHFRASLEEFSSTIFKQMCSYNNDRKFSCGIGTVYYSPVDVFRSYQEAKVALELGEILEIQIPYFSDLGLERILYKHDLQDIKEYFHSVLGELANYDSMNNAQLMETLHVFATHQFDMTATSKALFLHRNTLRYRLKKIEEILKRELNDLNNQLDIIAAFKIKQLRKL
ncbi:helix-turn-helix domain-containing protein [Bacillus sp. B15-48]|uniref:PucR family transcriptional regulator n=1 Tax=Bacillus sp. B15-48 TaxID=1548601 RepID=UPI00193F9CE9|nr:helix-turn-helix domain-containing protein [Bacillus sp. B15-48]